MKVKYILSDLDGVIRSYPLERTISIEQKFSLPKGIIYQIAFEQRLLNQAICGFITDDRWRIEIVKILSKVYDEKIVTTAINEWSDFAGIIDYRYLDITESKFPGIPIGVLTNGTSRLKAI